MATCTAAAEMTALIENVWHKLFIDSLFSSLNLQENLLTKTINYYGTVRPNKKKSRNFGKKPKIKWCDFTAPVWKDKQNMNILTNMHHPPAEGNFCDEHGNTLKLALIQDYVRCMGTWTKLNVCWIFTPSADGCGNGRKKLLFHLLELSPLVVQNYHKDISDLTDKIQEQEGCPNHI